MNGKLLPENESGGLADPGLLERRKRRAERGSAAAVVFGLDPATVRLDDGAGDGKTEAHSMRLGRVERVEQMFQSFYGIPAPVSATWNSISPWLVLETPSTIGIAAEGVPLSAMTESMESMALVSRLISICSISARSP